MEAQRLVKRSLSQRDSLFMATVFFVKWEALWRR